MRMRRRNGNAHNSVNRSHNEQRTRTNWHIETNRWLTRKHSIEKLHLSLPTCEINE